MVQLQNALAIASLLVFAHGPPRCWAVLGGVSCPDAEDEASLGLFQQQSSRRPSNRHAQMQVSVGAATSAEKAMTPVEAVNAAPDSVARLQMLKPIAWVHIPKCGSSVLNIFYQHPLICPFAAENVTLPTYTLGHYTGSGADPIPQFLKEHDVSTDCPGGFTLDYMTGYHVGIGHFYESARGHLVSMLRQPEQRIISAYHYGFQMWNAGTPPKDLHEYAVAMQGCQTKMLGRDSLQTADGVTHDPKDYLPCYDATPPTEAELATALHRLREGFAFVGLTEEWSLSTCLFHAKFGGNCNAADFQNMRPGAKRKGDTSMYNTSKLRGFRDLHDGRIYDEAKAMFYEDLQRFDVSMATCAEWCWPQTTASS